jgi:hypothetical protein
MKNISKTILTFLAAGVIGCGLLSSPAQAGLSTSGTLADLAANGGSIGIGDKVFSGFSFTTSGLTGFNAGNIIVSASIVGGVYYLDYSGNISVVGAPNTAGSADLLLKYTVTATAGQIFMIDQNYTGSASPRPGSFLSVDETVKAGGIIVANSHLDATDLSDPFSEPGDNLFVNPSQTTLDVTKDIAFGFGANNPDGSFVTISDVEQSFHQTVPEGGSAVALLGMALAGIEGARRLVRTRKA